VVLTPSAESRDSCRGQRATHHGIPLHNAAYRYIPLQGTAYGHHRGRGAAAFADLGAAVERRPGRLHDQLSPQGHGQRVLATHRGGA